jgi:hypothetical protein
LLTKLEVKTMAMDEMMEQMAGNLAASRMPAKQVEEEAPGGLAEIRSHLQAAMDLLDNMGGGEALPE